MSIFTDEGYENKTDFLQLTADCYGITLSEVKALVKGLTPEEVLEELDDLIEEYLEELQEELEELEYMD